MIEFYKPDRHTNPAPEEELGTKTTYAEPEDIRIVVDKETPPRETETFGQTAPTRQGSIPSPASAQQTYSPIDDIANTAKAYGEKIMEEINPGAGGFSRNLKNRNVSILLCALFGLLGAHRFYEGKIATGILWALTGGLGLIGWIIDLIILINKPKYYEP
ncbi:MAG: TM2 domain-containing protein [Huintestinicola sp.]